MIPSRGYFAIVILILVTACAGTAGDVIVDIPAHKPPQGTSALSGVPPAVIDIGDFRRSVETGVLPGRIGERKTIANISLGMVTVQPTPGRLVRDAFKAELEAAGHRSASSAASVSIDGEVKRFDLRTDVTALYWDVIFSVDVSVRIRNGAVEGKADYSAVCTERTYAWPGGDLIARLVTKCIGDLSGKFRNDQKIARTLAGSS